MTTSSSAISKLVSSLSKSRVGEPPLPAVGDAATVSAQFILPAGYSGIKVIGQGAYGVVVSAIDPLGRKVAVKRVPRWTSDVIDGKRVLREAKLLRFLAGHENIVELLSLESSRGVDDVFLVSVLFETDLHRVIYSRQDLTDDHL